MHIGATAGTLALPVAVLQQLYVWRLIHNLKCCSSALPLYVWNPTFKYLKTNKHQPQTNTKWGLEISWSVLRKAPRSVTCNEGINTRCLNLCQQVGLNRWKHKQTRSLKALRVLLPSQSACVTCVFRFDIYLLPHAPPWPHAFTCTGQQQLWAYNYRSDRVLIWRRDPLG